MKLGDFLAGGAGKNVVAALAEAYGVQPKLAEQAAEAVLPQLANRIERNTLSRGGLADLVALRIVLPLNQRVLQPPLLAR